MLSIKLSHSTHSGRVNKLKILGSETDKIHVGQDASLGWALSRHSQVEARMYKRSSHVFSDSDHNARCLPRVRWSRGSTWLQGFNAPPPISVLGVAEADGVSAPDHWSCPRLAVLLLKCSVLSARSPPMIYLRCPTSCNSPALLRGKYNICNSGGPLVNECQLRIKNLVIIHH